VTFQYETEDGKTVRRGDDAYDYYSMQFGVVGRDLYSRWFEFHHCDGTVIPLNGQRICSVEYAVSRGWLGEEARDQ
jgi:hypothetical protein